MEYGRVTFSELANFVSSSVKSYDYLKSDFKNQNFPINFNPFLDVLNMLGNNITWPMSKKEDSVNLALLLFLNQAIW